jgi:tetratricopeptide (TPR) repeat protein
MEAQFPVAKQRWLIVPLAALVLVGLSYGMSLLNGQNDAAQRPIGIAVEDPVGQIEPLGAGTAIVTSNAGDTDRRIAFWQERVRNTPESDQAYQYLGELFAQKGRETGDISWYARADEAFRQAVKLFSNNLAARAGLARNLVTLHRFKEAVAEGTAILQADLRAIGAVAIVGDASLELGDLDTAQAAFETLKKHTDGPGVDVRFARLAYLRGQTDEAIRLAEQAATTAAGVNASVEEVAFYRYVAGEYRFSKGDVAGADQEYASALEMFPGYYLALAGRGRTAFATGDLDAAVHWLQSAVAIVPRVELLAYLGDLYAVQGKPAQAEEQYAAVDFIGQLGDVQAEVFNRELSLFQATHERNPAHALKLASDELVNRADIFGYDAYAWALYANGRATDALTPAREALALNTRDPKLLFHAGMIEMAAGELDAGRTHLQAALALNPMFDPLGSRMAREALDQ